MWFLSRAVSAEPSLVHGWWVRGDAGTGRAPSLKVRLCLLFRSWLLLSGIKLLFMS